MNYRIDKIHNQKSGIYLIKSTVNGKSYIGSSVCLRKRYREHKCRLKGGKHSNPHLQSHYNKHGKNSLEYFLIEVTTKNKLQEREQHYVDKLDPEFNIMKKCVVNRIGLKHSDEAKRKMKKAAKKRKERGDYKKLAKISSEVNKGNKYNLGKKHSEETKKKISESSTGRKHSPKTRQKISKKLKGREFSKKHRDNLSKAMTGNKNCLGRVLSEETKEKISQANGIELYQLTLDGEIIRKWDSATKASLSLNINQANISSCANGNRNHAGGFRWVKTSQS